MNYLMHAVFVGIGATALMDLWGVLRRQVLGARGLDLAMLGRWIGHMTRGRFRHANIGDASLVRRERSLGWGTHYLIGVSFSMLLLTTCGLDWLRQPTPGPALTIGILTVAAPLFLMQPAMGLGVAASRAPNPWRVRLHSLMSHTAFGLGLYVTAWLDHLLFYP